MIPNRLKYIVVLLLWAPLCLTSQNDSISGGKRVWTDFKYDGASLLKGVGNAFTQPLRWQKDDFITAGSIVAGTGLLYLADAEAQRYFSEQGETAPDIIRDFGWYFGSPQNFFMITAGIYGFGILTNNPKVRYTGVLIISSAVASGLFQQLTKTAVGRARPTDGNRNDFKPFANEPGFSAFPSGHTILSFTMAHAIAKQFDNIWVKAGIYALGSIAPLSRLWEDAHWISDIGFGMAFSIAVVDGMDNFFKRKQRYQIEKPKQISWQLRMGYGTIGVVGTF